MYGNGGYPPPPNGGGQNYNFPGSNSYGDGYPPPNSGEQGFPGSNNYGGGYPPSGEEQSFPGGNIYPPPGSSYSQPPPVQQAYGDQSYQNDMSSPGVQLTQEEESMFQQLNFDESMDLSQMVSAMTKTPVSLDQNQLEDSVRSTRGLFDPESNKNSYQQYNEMVAGNRGLFGFGSGDSNGKSPLSHQLLAGAVAYASVNWWLTKQRNENKPVSKAGLKKLVAAAAAALAVRKWEQHGGLQSGISRDVVMQEAAQNAMRDYDFKVADQATKYEYNYQTHDGEAGSFDNQPQQQPPPQGGNNYYNYQQQGYPHQGGYSGY